MTGDKCIEIERASESQGHPAATQCICEDWCYRQPKVQTMGNSRRVTGDKYRLNVLVSHKDIVRLRNADAEIGDTDSQSCRLTREE